MRMVKTMLLAAGLVLVTAVPAAAAPINDASSDGGGWEPTSTEPFVIPAGLVCAFEVKGDIVADNERMRTVATFPDGSPRVQDFQGVLVIRYTNTSNQRTVVRDATGSIRLYLQADGSKIWQFHGHNALPVRAANTGFPGGDYIIRGDFVVVDSPDRVREIPVQLGTMENLCLTLA